MGRDYLTVGQQRLVAELRGPGDLIRQAGQMPCLAERRWEQEVIHASSVGNGSLRFLNFSPEEQWDILIRQFSSEFAQLCAAYTSSHHVSPQPEAYDSMEFEPALRFRVEGVPDLDSFQGIDPVRLSDSVRVIHSGKVLSHENALPGDQEYLDIFIESGWAFGTGTHPSTVCSVMAMEWLMDRRMFHEHSRVLDVGTGTGILAIAAALMGAGAVAAVDIDPEALRLARYNAKVNGVDNIVSITSSQELFADRSMHGFDICLANLTLSVASMLLPEVVPLLEPGGLLMLSGFKRGAAGTALDLLAGNGLSQKEFFSSGSWCSILAGNDQGPGKGQSDYDNGNIPR